MYNFNPVEWVLAQSRIKYEDNFLIEGLPFQLMSLSEENIVAARLLTTSQGIIELAASGGFAINRKRTIESEDESLINSLALLWEQEEVLAFNDPSIMFSVGEKVCELSGLTLFLDETLAYEENDEKELAALLLEEDETLIIDGDKAINPEITLGQLQADTDAHYAQG